jgi:hypothetical protein
MAYTYIHCRIIPNSVSIKIIKPRDKYNRFLSVQPEKQKWSLLYEPLQLAFLCVSHFRTFLAAFFWPQIDDPQKGGVFAS